MLLPFQSAFAAANLFKGNALGYRLVSPSKRALNACTYAMIGKSHTVMPVAVIKELQYQYY